MHSVQFYNLPLSTHQAYHLRGTRKGFLEASLFDHTFDLDRADQQAWSQYLWDHGITYLGNREDSLLYARIVKLLSVGKRVFMGYFDEANAAKRISPETLPEAVVWLPGIEFTQGEQKARQYGCQTPLEFMTAVQYSNKSLNNRGYYLAEVDREGLDRYIQLFRSDVTQWVFFVVDNPEKLRGLLLDADQRPELGEVVACVEVMVQVQIGCDEGYVDYVLVSAQKPLTSEIMAITEDLKEFGYEYEAILETIAPVDERWKTEWFTGKMRDLRVR